MKTSIRDAIGMEDVLLFVGLILMGVGLWLYRPWISLTVTGAVLMMIGGMPLLTATVRSMRNGNHK